MLSERAHAADYEWWYAHGYLTNEAERQYGFMYAFFKFRKETVAQYFPQLRAFPGHTLFQLHLGLTDITAGTHHADELTFLPWLGHIGLGRLRFGVRFGPNYLRTIGPKRFALHAEHHQRTLDLHMFDQAGTVLHGRNGVIKVNGFGETSYYSRPRLKVEGQLKFEKGQTEFVHGSAWLDHQWGRLQPPQPFMYWIWFGIQLQDGSTLMLYEFIDGHGRKRAVRGTWLGSQGQRRNVTALITPLRYWRSSKTGSRFPIDHAVSVAALKLKLQITADVADQEMHSAFFNYWEGACSVNGQRAGRPTQGKAYLEVTRAE